MTELNRIVAFSLKGPNITFPSLSCNWQATIRLDGTASLGLRFWKNSFFRRVESKDQDKTCLDQIAGFYFLKVRPETFEYRDFPHSYWCLYANDNLPNFCLTLLQLGIEAEAHLVVLNRDKMIASFVVSSAQPIEHVLEQHFPSAKKIPHFIYRRAREGWLYKPRVLTRFSLPRLPGIDEAMPLPIPVPSPIAGDGHVSLGEALSPLSGNPVCPMLVSNVEINRGTLVVGATGSGKTNTVMRIVDQLRPRTSVLVFDVKGEYRSLHKTMSAAVYGFREKNLLTMNLLKAEGSPSEWVKQFSSIFSEAISKTVRASGSKDVIAEELDRLYRDRGVYDGLEDWPHIGDLLEALDARSQRTQSDREKNWLASALRVMRTLSIGRTKDAFHVRNGLSTQRLLTGVSVVDLDALGDPDGVNLVMSVLLQRIRNNLSSQPIRDELKHLIVIEEAQNILAAGAEASSVIGSTCREIRAFGVGLVYVTQIPSEFSKNAMSNVSTIVSHRLVHPEDKRVIGQMMGLDPKIFEGLETGHALVKTSTVALVRVPLIERPFVPESELPTHVVTREEVSTDFGRRNAVQGSASDLTPRDWEVFLAVAESRGIYPKSIGDLLGYSHTEVSECLHKLNMRGLVRYRPGKVQGAPGKARSIQFLSPNGEEAYRAKTGRYADQKDGPSLNHEETVQRVRTTLAIAKKPSHPFDILFDKGLVERAIEVETGSNNNTQLLKNLVKSVEFQDDARFVSTDQTTENRVLQVAARWCFTERRAVTVHVGLLESLPKWKVFHFEPKAPTP